MPGGDWQSALERVVRARRRAQVSRRRCATRGYAPTRSLPQRQDQFSEIGRHNRLMPDMTGKRRCPACTRVQARDGAVRRCSTALSLLPHSEAVSVPGVVRTSRGEDS